MQQHSASIAMATQPNASQPSYVIGVDIGGTKLRLALADISGTVLARWSASTVDIRNADKVVLLIAQGVDILLAEVNANRRTLRAIAAAAPGITDPDRGIVVATSYLMGWINVPLRALLEAELNIPAAIDNDVNLAALGEGRAGIAQGTPDFVFLAIGTGLGAGILLNNQIFRGHAFIAGEIGYILVPGVSEDPIPRGQPGALEQIIGGEGIKSQWQRHWNPSLTKLPLSAAPTEIFDEAITGDTLAQQVLVSTARALSYAIYNIALILNCPLFVFGGTVGLHPALIEATRHALQQRSVRVQPQLLPSALGSDAQLIGAIRLALDTANVSAPKP
jgi:glucokinase